MTSTQENPKDNRDYPVDLSVVYRGIGWVFVVLAVLSGAVGIVAGFVEGWDEASSIVIVILICVAGAFGSFDMARRAHASVMALRGADDDGSGEGHDKPGAQDHST